MLERSISRWSLWLQWVLATAVGIALGVVGFTLGGTIGFATFWLAPGCWSSPLYPRVVHIYHSQSSCSLRLVPF